MRKLSVLDVTLRDGGCINNFNFGQVYMNKILFALEESNVEYIELGYIDDKKGTIQGRTQYCNESVISQFFLKEKKPGKKYLTMMDYGKYDVKNLSVRTNSSIDGIRLAFHKKDKNEIVKIGKEIIEKGYEFYIQPMITMRYSDIELLELIDMVNCELKDANGLYIVDSFGEMRANDLNRLMNIIDHNLVSTMSLGFHSHNNLQLSYSNAMELLRFPTERNIILDSSIMGMGKGAGNLNTELLLEHINLYYGGKYNIEPLLKVMDEVISVIRDEYYWGYRPEYYLSSINHCTPSYASYYYDKHMLSMDQIANLLGKVEEDKKISFDLNYAEQKYQEFRREKHVDDSQFVKIFSEKLINKSVILIAPGKSILQEVEKIKDILGNKDIVSISLNNFDLFETDYIFITRAEMLDALIRKGKNVITLSNLYVKDVNYAGILDYRNWAIFDGETHDSAGIIIMNLLRRCKIGELILAGFDGFSNNINENYYDNSIRRTISEIQVEKNNAFNKKFIAEISKEVRVTFLTDSKYM